MLTAAKLDFSAAKLKCCQTVLACVVSPEKLAFQGVKLQFPSPNGMMKPTHYVAAKKNKGKLINFDRLAGKHFMHESS